MSRTYATEPQFETWLGETPPSGAARLLRDASLEIDDMLFTAIYNVDHDDMPTDPKVAAALRDATCAQAEHRHEYGTAIDIAQSGEAITLGPLKLGGASSTGTTNAIPVNSPAAHKILRTAGLIPGGMTDG